MTMTMAKRLSDEVAEASLRGAGIEPLEPYVSVHTPWLSRCLSCGAEITPRLHEIRRGSGCFICSQTRKGRLSGLMSLKRYQIFDHCDLYIVALRWPSGFSCGKIGISREGSRRRGDIERQSGASVELIHRWQTTAAVAMLKEHEILNGPLLARDWRMPDVERQEWPGRTETFPLRRSAELIDLVGPVPLRGEARIGPATLDAWEEIGRIRAGQTAMIRESSRTA